MLYENKSQVDVICTKIKDMEQLLKDLNSNVLHISLHAEGLGRILDIGTWDTCDHDYKEFATLFVDTLKAKVGSEIAALKVKLSKL